jgi:hypothetical protein
MSPGIAVSLLQDLRGTNFSNRPFILTGGMNDIGYDIARFRPRQRSFSQYSAVVASHWREGVAMRTMESGAGADRNTSASHRINRVLCSLLLLTLIPLWSLSAALPGNEAWSDKFFLPGLDGGVTAVALSGTDVIAAGNFKFADGLRVNHIARWDGSSWSAFGSGIPYEINGITVSGGSVIAAYKINTVQGSRVVQWSGSSWQQIGAFTSGDITAIADWQGSPVVAGSFQNVDGNPLPYLAVWDGAAWSALGTGPGTSVSKIVAIGSTLYAATGASLLMWDGGNWTPVGASLPQSIVALGEFNSAPAVCYGSSSVSAWYVALWSGTSWNAAGGQFSGPVNALVQKGTALVATGGFQYVNGAPLSTLASWDSAVWSQIAAGLSAEGTCLAVTGSDLIVGGAFSHVYAKAVHFLSAYDGIEWKQYFASPVTGQGILGDVRCYAQFNGQLVAGGAFTTAGGRSALGVAALNNGQWEPLASGLYGVVRTLCEFNGMLIAGGSALRLTPENTDLHALFAWDGNMWTPLGPVEMGLSPIVNDLIVFDSKLVAVGAFSTIGGSSANNVASYNGASWAPLGSGWSGLVNDAELLGGRLIVGGPSTSHASGVSENGLAAWNGIAWERVSTSAPLLSYGAVNDLNVHNGNLEITTADDVIIWSPANPSEWRVNHIPGSPEALATTHFFASTVVAGGGQGLSDTLYIRQYDGAEWQLLGKGVSNTANALFRIGDQLFVGGVFDEAGGKASAGVAVWQPYGPQCCIGSVGNYDSDPQDITDISDLQALVDFLFFGGVINPCPGEVDIDASGAVDISDLTWLISFMFTGEPLPSCM